jgi:hypothetical protein
MATQTHAPHHVRADALAGAFLMAAAVLVAGGTAAFLAAQGGGTVVAPHVAEAPVQPMLLTPTSVERARLTAVQPMLLTPTSVERARLTAVQPMLLTPTSVERATIVGAATQQAGADAGSAPERRGGR